MCYKTNYVPVILDLGLNNHYFDSIDNNAQIRLRLIVQNHFAAPSASVMIIQASIYKHRYINTILPGA